MAQYKQYANMWQRVRPMVQSGLWAKPEWYEGARRAPPIILYKVPAPPEIKLPEDKLYNAVLRRHPMLELEQEGPTDFKRTIAHRFAQKQLALMNEESMTRDEAFLRCEKSFQPEMKQLEKTLDGLHEQGAKQASFNAIKRNVSQHARVSGTISTLLETRVDLHCGGALYENPLYSTKDTRERRRAKIERLKHDPAIAHIKALFRQKKPSVLKALEVLVLTPDSEEAPFWQAELRDFFKRLTKDLYTLDDVPGTSEARREGLAALKMRLHKVNFQVKEEDFVALSKATQAEVIEIAREAVKLRLMKEEGLPPLRVTTELQNAAFKVRELKQKLDSVSSERSLREIQGSEYGLFVEGTWWDKAEARKKMMAQVEASREGR